MYTGTVRISGVDRQVTATISPVFNRDAFTLTLTASLGDFAFSKSYIIRSNDMRDTITDFRDAAAKAITDRNRIALRLIQRGFTLVQATP